MSNSRPICLFCRSALSAARARRAIQWQARASSSQAFQHAQPDSNTADHGRSQRDNKREVLSTARIRNARTPGEPASAPSRIDALFQEILKETSGQSTSPTPHPEGSSVDLELYESLAKLEEMVENNASALPAFRFLKGNIYPAVQKPGTHVPRIFKTTILKLLRKIAREKKESLASLELPTVAEISKVYMDVGALRGKEWASLVSRVVIHLCQMSSLPQDYPSVQSFEASLATRDVLLADLVDSWRVLSAPKTVKVEEPNANDDRRGFWLPRLDKHSLTRYSKKGQYDMAISTLFPDYAPSQLVPHVPVLAISTYALLTDPTKSNVLSRQGAAPFIEALAQIITVVRLPQSQLRKSIEDTYPELLPYITSRWPDVVKQLKIALEGAYQTNTKRLNEQDDNVAQKNAVDTKFIHQLEDALRSSNISRIKSLWHEFCEQGKLENEDRKSLKDSPEVFNTFLYACLATNQSHQMIVVWNTMQHAGIPITIKTWNAMLDGCKKARNAAAIRNIWSKLVATGMPLDEGVWTTRVSGLIDSGEPQEGIDALKEMARLWGDNAPGAVQPGVAPVNAALAGLIRLNDLVGAQRLLAWAGHQGIQPDVYTFNTLLRPLIRKGSRSEVERAFVLMRELGIEADAATFTIILEDTLQNIGHLSTEEQTETIKHIFSEMQSAGLQTNMQTYGKMMFMLMRHGHRTQEAVKFVLSHINARGLQMSRHIYTELVKYYFSLSPPDIKAVDALISRHKLHERSEIDRVFWERVIEGYSNVGDTETALKICREISARGTTLRVDSQTELLRVLIQKGDIHEARHLVEDTYSRVKEAHPEIEEGRHGQRLWRHRFWHLAASHGLIPTNAAAGTFGS